MGDVSSMMVEGGISDPNVQGPLYQFKEDIMHISSPPISPSKDFTLDMK